MLAAGCTLWAAATASLSINDLHAAYGTIFPSNNRNAASHLWSSWILNQAASLSHSELSELFTGFCPVSGSPVRPSDYNTYQYSLPGVAGAAHAVGTLHHCCAPCVCDTLDMIHHDSKTVTLADGPRQLSFAVIGDPCTHASVLARPFNDPFSGSEVTLAATAPEVQCIAGKLRGATYSDNGAIIIGLLGAAPPLGPAPETPTPGRVTSVGGASFQDAREYAGFCRERAQSGYSSGMGLIFREVAQITSLDAPAPPHPLAASSSRGGPCDGFLPAARRAEIARLIASEPVLMLGMRHMRCTAAAAARLEGAGACFRWEAWDEASEPLWSYMKCLHPHEEVGGMQMHSYVYIGGKYIGNGFALSEEQMRPNRLQAKLQAANARMDCHEDCGSLAPAEERQRLAEMVAQPLALLGWNGCPCTNIARTRFESMGACYLQQVWPTDTAPLYKHLQCVYGKHHHSFVFIGGKFVGDGFALEQGRMAQTDFEAAVRGAGTSLQCQRAGDQSLHAKPLQSCTQSNDGSTTGWARTGSCNWDPSDSGYHEVCVTMSQEFLEASARHDANDLSSVVQAGGHWCICAWAFASAVQRDPSKYEGITLDCDRTNAKLREVYEMHIASNTDLTSPSGASYKAKAALDAVNQLCPPPTAATAARLVTSAAAAPAAAAAAPAATVAPAVASSAAAPSPLYERQAGGSPLFLMLALLLTAAGGCVLVRRHRGAAQEAAPLSSTDYREKEVLGFYDSGGESEVADNKADEPLRVRATPATRDTV